MTPQAGNLTTTERVASAGIGLVIASTMVRQKHPLLRLIGVVAGAALLARSYGGYCGVKAAAAGEESLKDGLSKQWGRMRRVSGSAPSGNGVQASQPTHLNAIDDTVNDSFPASDPPASHLPDVPPVNAQAKWDAALAKPG